MAYFQNLPKKLPIRRPLKITRNLSQTLRDRSSKSIRNRFLEYFINEHNHTFVRSSPVVPFCDPTVPFVNAGMNQFKGIFLGKKAAHSKVANTQKCVRIGGKHNDLNLVGTDSYHHTFFEMMGNWSFGDCNKTEACKLSWDLLIRVFGFNPFRLYVTYFSGDSQLQLEPDLETKEVWMSLGVPSDRILGFGMKDNFWEMGLTGPCGPCTEIHYDHFGQMNRAQFINKGLPDLIELWNLVFIQYNKTEDGQIKALPERHVDTGMGFERLAAIMQGKLSNYDTDIFAHIFGAISKICPNVPKYGGRYGEKDWNGLDTAYRTLADHARMITVCLGDGMIPEQNQKLRKIMRRAYVLSEANFRRESGLLKELTNYVVECLGYIYPEMEKNIKQIHQIVDYEEETYRSIRQEASDDWKKITEQNPNLLNLDVIESPGLIRAYHELKTFKRDVLTPELSYKLYDTYGLDDDTISAIARALNLKFNVLDFEEELIKIKTRSKLNSSSNVDGGLLTTSQPTNDAFKYDYKRDSNKYNFGDLEVTILDVVCNDNSKRLAAEMGCSLVLDKTNFYSESGGQISDRGVLKVNDEEVFRVVSTRNLNGCVLHDGELKRPVKRGDKGTLCVDYEFRLNTMRNHTGVHLLNAMLKKIKTATCQKSSKVTDQFLSLDVAIFTEKLSMSELQAVENQINKVIKEAIEVKTEEVSSDELLRLENVTVIPGEVYPESGIRLVQVEGKDGFISREPCCGTHVHNTSDLEDFCIVGFKSLGKSTTSLHAVTGPRAKVARQNGALLLDDVTQLQKNIDDNIDKPEILQLAVNKLRDKLTYDVNSPHILPALVKLQCSSYLNCIEKQLKQIAKGTLKEFIEMEMQNVLQTNKGRTHKNQEYVVHYLRCSMILENVPLQRATKLCPDLPILVIAYSDNMVKARCCVPKNLKNENFNAEKWLNGSVSAIFKSTAAAPKGQDPALICNMKAKRVNLQDWDTLLNESLRVAKNYVEKYL